MILSSADILRILGNSEIIRLSAHVSVTDGRPALAGQEGIYIYVNRFPSLQEFEATWQIWIESDEEDDLIVAEIKRLLPRVQVTKGIFTTISTTEFRSESTQKAPEPPVQVKAQVDLTEYEKRFEALAEDIQDQMLLVNSGRPGADGKDGRDGADGRDGKDIEASETDLEDLRNVEDQIVKERGQVLTWDGTKWTNRFIPQTIAVGGGGGGGGQINSDTIASEEVPTEREDGKGELRNGDGWFKPSTEQLFIYNDGAFYLISGGGGGGGGIEEAPIDGKQYARQNADWTEVASPEVPVTSVNGQVGDVVLDADDIDDSTTTNKFVTAAEKASIATALQPNDNVSELVNDAGYITAADVPASPVTSVAGKTGDVTLVKADITDFNDDDYATAAQGDLADTSLQPGDNISELNNDAGYITAADVPETGVTRIVAGDNVTISPESGEGEVTINAVLPVGGGVLDGGDFNTGADAPDGTAMLDGGIFT